MGDRREQSVAKQSSPIITNECMIGQRKQSVAKQSFNTLHLYLLDFTTRSLHFIRDDPDFILLIFQDLSC